MEVVLQAKMKKVKQLNTTQRKAILSQIAFFISTSMKQNTIIFVIQIKCLPLYN